MNIHIIHGRLVRDPELTKGSEESRDRCNITIAVDRRYGDEADFFDCVIFGKRAGVVDKYFSKGKEILIKGEGQLRSYEGKDGVKRKSYSIVIDDFDFCGGSSKAANVDTNKLEADAKALLMPKDNMAAQEEDIPF